MFIIKTMEIIKNSIKDNIKIEKCKKAAKERKYCHKELAAGRWNQLSFIEQMANIGSEVCRTIKWKNNKDFANKAFVRALELFDLTIMDPKNRKRLKEVVRARELFADYIVGDNQYNFSDECWQKYFYHFNYAARVAK